MEEQKNNIRKKDSKFNWKLVIISFIIIIIFYFAASHLIANRVPKETLYCYFDRSLNDSAPRNECALFKIITRGVDLNEEDFKNLDISTDCSENFNDLPACDGETYHFTEIELSNLCTSPKFCDVNGLICGAYFVTYYNNNSFIKIYEELAFTEPNLKSEEELMNKFNGCDN